MKNKEKKTNNGTAQRAELHRKIWAIADSVRGAVDGWDFKQYVLGMLFYRYISENITFLVFYLFLLYLFKSFSI